VLCCRIHWAVTNKLCSFLLHFKTFFQSPKNVTHIFQLSHTFFIHWLCTGFVDALCISSVCHRVEVIFIHYRMPCCTCYCCVVSAYFSAMYAVLCWSCVFVHMWLLACSSTGTLSSCVPRMHAEITIIVHCEPSFQAPFRWGTFTKDLWCKINVQSIESTLHCEFFIASYRDVRRVMETFLTSFRPAF